MAKTVLNYEKMWGDALRGIVRQALHAAENGLPGGHHFYITFRTRHPGVDISDALRARFPDEMTIVLQHQYWGLEIGEEGFGVTLSFNRINERLEIPYAAVSAFADPFAKFGVQIPTDGSVELPLEDLSAEEEEEPASEPAIASPPSAAEGARVVTLDAFRKK